MESRPTLQGDYTSNKVLELGECSQNTPSRQILAPIIESQVKGIMKDIHTRYIQVRGKMELSQTLSPGQDQKVLVTVTAIEQVDNQDGTYDEIYKARLFDTLEGDQ